MRNGETEGVSWAGVTGNREVEDVIQAGGNGGNENEYRKGEGKVGESGGNGRSKGKSGGKYGGVLGWVSSEKLLLLLLLLFSFLIFPLHFKRSNLI